MEKKVVLITGCSSGIGLSLAVRLASEPSKTFKVYATMRNLAKKERLLECVKDLHQGTLEILQMDVTDRQSIMQAKDMIVEKRVDILVCNAGVGLVGPLEVQHLDSMRHILEVNLLGTIQTIQAFLSEMKARRQGHILVTGSTGGLHGLPFNDMYCASKFAIEGACESLAVLLQHFNIHVSLIECGPVNTDFLVNLQKAELGDPSLQQVDTQTLSLYEKYLQHCSSVFQNAAQDTEDIVKVFLTAIQSSSPALRYFTGSVVPPLTDPKLTQPDGLQYIRAMSKIIFSSEEQ
ncbi:17-beta-hydroxysteroid dehydrogenase type 1 [Nothobranchius furzeri]|uniref:Estradiol 17-beta-dehydrogenase n=2 Tax=Nothobranchius TaxID=28779 RepID=A0A8C6NJG1_NOTFU|nr:estradiol 17-beta-dehydrogenase 1 [Nothobranchius furzeri]XP_054596145.1 estradiol 17-beta-dehydrogenase 1 [Nothobranchius furzeri]KAF7199140.1 hydroxysteroid (17-beta) dehydrogenase 1 [Nothobranchius furzeri]